MDTEQIWNLWLVLHDFMNKKQEEEAIEEFLNFLYENDAVNFEDLRDMAEEEEETLFVKILKRFIKENEIEEDEY